MSETCSTRGEYIKCTENVSREKNLKVANYSGNLFEDASVIKNQILR